VSGLLIHLRAAPTLLRIGFAEMVAYRAEVAVWILTATLPLVMLALWSAAADGGTLGSFSQDDFVRYFAVILVVRQVTSAWLVWELNYNVRTGALSPMLLRPLNPLWWNLAETVGALPLRIIVLSPILAVLIWWKPQIALLPSAATFFLGCVSVFLAFVLAWLVQAVFGMLAFWYEQSVGLYNLWFVAVALLGGYVIPMDLLPSSIVPLARVLPFHSALGAPVEVWLDATPDPCRTLALQAVWVAVTATAAWFMWGRGLRRYGAVGA